MFITAPHKKILFWGAQARNASHIAQALYPSVMGPSDDTLRLAESKLSASGLTLDDASRLGIEILDADRTEALHPSHRQPSLLLRYHNPDHTARDVWRVRLLGEPPPGAWGAVPSKPRRYLQPAGTACAVYWPRTVDWATYLAAPTNRLLLTEGELKAACAAKLGMPCLGLGGVSSWRSARRGWDLLPELAAVSWLGRDVYLIYDSDAATNVDIATAASTLASELRKRGALPRIIVLPPVEGLAKTGLDDYLLAHGVVGLSALLAAAQSDPLAEALWRLNAEYAYVADPGLIVSEAGAQFKPSSWTEHVVANLWAAKSVASPGGAPKLKQVQVAKEWITWPQRRQYAGLTYAPGEGPIHEDRVNLWRGYKVASSQGDVGPWSQLLDHLCGGAEAGARRWLEQWLAWPVARPRQCKMASAVGLWSIAQGVGKSLVGMTMGRIYGDNYACITQRDLESTFNGWAARRQLIMVDDVSAHDSRAKADIFKSLITQELLRVNIKHIPEYFVQDRCNYLLTSNRANAFYLDDRDRRWFILEVTAVPLPRQWYADYVAWLDGAGAGALRAHFEALDFYDFDPHGPPPMTAAKRDMLRHGKGELAQWIADLRDDPDSMLILGSHRLDRDLYQASELLEMFDASRKGPQVTAAAMGVQLREAFPTVLAGDTVKVGGRSARYYAVRRCERWASASKDDVLRHLREWTAYEQSGGF